MSTFTVSEIGPYTTINAALVDAIAERASSGQPQTIVVYPKSNNGVYGEQIGLDVDGIIINGIVENGNRVQVAGYYIYTNGTSNVNGGKNVLSKVDCTGIRFYGSNVQHLVAGDINTNSQDNHAIDFTNTGYDSDGYSSISINGGTFITGSQYKNALRMTNGYMYANNVQFTNSTTAVCANVTAGNPQSLNKKSGLEISTGSFVGQVRFDLTQTVVEGYTNLSLNKVSIRTEGDLVPLYVKQSRAFLTGVTFVNPQSVKTIDDQGSIISYKNIVSSVGTSIIPVKTVPRDGIAPDPYNVGALLVNDDRGYISALNGTINGQTVAWNSSLGKWEAVLGALDFPSKSFIVSDASGLDVGRCVSFVNDVLVQSSPATEQSSNSFGIVKAVTVNSSTSVTVKVAIAGDVTTLSSLSSYALGQELYCGPDGTLVTYADLNVGDWVTVMGKVLERGSGAINGSIALNIRQVGIKT